MDKRVVIVGAGVAGLVAALLLAARGVAVTVLERAPTPGGKLRQLIVGGLPVDAGPTVFTLRRVWDEIFAEAGAPMPFALMPLPLLARHAWNTHDRLDLFADRERSAAAIGDFAGAAEARGYLTFCERAARIWRTLEQPYIRGENPTPLSLVRAAGVAGMLGVSPFQTLWRALGEHFSDPRLRQLFGRYATYSGSSPFQAPGTLMLIAHVEQEGVWTVDGGMHRIASGLAGLAEQRGASLRHGEDVVGLVTASGRTTGVRLAGGETVAADAVLFNGDVAALAAGRLGSAAKVAVAAAVAAPGARSLSALTWATVATAEGFPLARHNVFFGPYYRGEFDDVFKRRRLPRNPTVYVCAQDREPEPHGPERLLCLVNAPATGDATPDDEAEMARCEMAMDDLLARCGLTLRRTASVRTGPAEWERLFPATGGALYGPAQHGWGASFARPPSRSRIPGLYLAGGSTHPGPGLPMAALSGRLAAQAILADLTSHSRVPRSRVSTNPSRATAMSGGTSTR